MKIFTAAGRQGLMLLAMLVSMAANAQNDVDLENEESRIAYSVGVNIGRSLVQQQLLQDIDLDAFVAGLRDEAAGESQLNDEEIMAAIQTFQQRMQDQQAAETEMNRERSEQFLSENAERDGVVTLPSGLQYEVMEEGAADAASPSADDTVLAHYHGTLVDGSVFDSSVDRGQPAQFGLSQVIAGWTEALQLMQVGDKWRLFIPADQAYGESGSPPVIPPNSALIFEVELLEIL
ncbi:MAG: FKBP-type peptidyl-prolyl cis-trans isomerase [Pseudohongiellaceae bacterium]